MPKQLDVLTEKNSTRRQEAIVRALDFGLVGALESQGIELLGFSVSHDAYSCRIVLRADIGGRRSVAFVYAGNIINCVLRAQADAQNDNLRWGKDKYKGSGS